MIARPKCHLTCPLQKDLVCDECQFAARELKTIVEDKEKQQEIRDFFSKNVCKNIPRYQGMVCPDSESEDPNRPVVNVSNTLPFQCDMLVEQFLPEMFQELDTLLKDPKQVACS